MKTFEDYLEEKFIEENPEHYVKGFQYEGYYENWVMNLDRAKLIELAEEAIKEESKRERERIIKYIDTLISSDYDWNLKDLSGLLKQVKGKFKK